MQQVASFSAVRDDNQYIRCSPDQSTFRTSLLCSRALTESASQLPFFRQLLFDFFDGFENVAHFFDSGEYLIGAEFQETGFLLFQTVRDFIPSNRSGNGRLFLRA